MEDRIIDISTNKGLVARFHHTDRRIATLESLYEDAITGESNVPDTIVLSGEAGKIADAEGADYLRTIRTSEILGDEPISDTMVKLLDPEAELPRLDPDLTYSLVPYQKVERISRIFDLQSVDYLGMYVDAKTPKHLRDYYYTKIGNYILDSSVGKRDISVLLKVGRGSVLSKLIDFMRTKNDTSSGLFTVAIAIIYNMLNLSASSYYSSGTLRIREEVIVWSDLVEVMRESSTTDEMTSEDASTIELFQYLAGDDVPSFTFEATLNLARANFFYARSIPLLLSVGLKRMPEDISPEHLGLAKLMDSQDNPSDSDGQSNAMIATVISAAIKGVYGAQYAGLGQVGKATQLRNKLGNYATQRILISILLYLEQSKKIQGYAKLNALARGLEKLQ